MLLLSDITLRVAGRALYDGASAAIPEGARVGFVGRNGTGKTTLFRAILGEIAPDDGRIGLPKGTRIGAVAQEAPAGPESLIEVVLAADTERAALLAESDAAGPDRRAEIEERLVAIGAHAAEARAGAILHGLGFDAAAQVRPCAEFSGGWRMRVALAALLFAEPDLLLLDEPTNYLDLEGTLWLHRFLSRYPRTAIIISHDRDLLEEAVDHILHLDGAKLTLYRGGYETFARKRAETARLQAKSAAKQADERVKLEAFIARFRAKASKARQAQSRVKRLEKMETITLAGPERGVVFDFPSPERPLSPPMIAMDEVALGYGERIILRGLGLSLAPDDRIALLGSNGNGKSTFAKLLAGRLDPLGGHVRRAPKLRVAYFAQHQTDELDEEGTPLSHVTALRPGVGEAQRRSLAARIGFPGAAAGTKVSSLSGGEKARLLLGLATLDAPHLLVLDEPTNHLDIDARASLAEALNAYEGAVVLVSHDRFLLEATADRLWLVENGGVRAYDGDLDDYRRLVLSGEEAPAKAEEPSSRPAASPAVERRASAGLRASLAPKRKRLDALDQRTVRLAASIQKIDAALADGNAFARQPAKAAELARMRSEAARVLAETEEEWLALGAEIEAAERGIAA